MTELGNLCLRSGEAASALRAIKVANACNRDTPSALKSQARLAARCPPRCHLAGVVGTPSAFPQVPDAQVMTSSRQGRPQDCGQLSSAVPSSYGDPDSSCKLPALVEKPLAKLFLQEAPLPPPDRNRLGQSCIVVPVARIEPTAERGP